MTVHFNKQRQRWTYDFNAGGKRFQGYCRLANGDFARTHAEATASELIVRAIHRPRSIGLKGYVYFAQTTDGAMIKIGWSKAPKQRLKSLGTASAVPVQLIGKVRGTIQDEKKHHQALADYRSHGEWFHATEPVLAYIQSVIKRSEARALLIEADIINSEAISTDSQEETASALPVKISVSN